MQRLGRRGVQRGDAVEKQNRRDSQTAALNEPDQTIDQGLLVRRGDKLPGGRDGERLSESVPEPQQPGSGSRNRAQALRVVRVANSSRGRPSSAAMTSAVIWTKAGSFRLPRTGWGGR